MPTAQASTGNRPDSQWQKKKIAAAAGSCKTMSNTSNRSVVRCCGWRMLALLLASLPSQPPPPRLQSMAASVHGSANIRCVSSPSGGLSSRRAYLSSRCSFFFFFLGGWRGGDISGQIKHLASALIPPQATYGRVSSSHEVSGTMMIINNKMKISKKKKKKGNSEDTCAEISPTAGACHRPPSASQKTSQPTSQPAPSSHPLSTSCCCEMCVSRSRLTLPIVCT